MNFDEVHFWAFENGLAATRRQWDGKFYCRQVDGITKIYDTPDGGYDNVFSWGDDESDWELYYPERSAREA